MQNAVHHFLVGLGSIFLAPAGGMARPQMRITLPPESASQAIGRDFSLIGRDFVRAIDRVGSEAQMEFSLKAKE